MNRETRTRENMSKANSVTQEEYQVCYVMALPNFIFENDKKLDKNITFIVNNLIKHIINLLKFLF